MSVYRQKMEFWRVWHTRVSGEYGRNKGNYSTGVLQYTVTDLSLNGYGTYTETETRRSACISLPALDVPIDQFESAKIHLEADEYFEGTSERIYVDVFTSDHSNDSPATLFAATGSRVGVITVYKNGGGDLMLTKA